MSTLETPSQLSPELFKKLSPPERAWLQRRAQWLTVARPDQLTPPGNWPIWLALAGRGWGKTRVGAEDVASYGCENAGVRIAVVAPTFADARDTCIEGESGLLAVLPKICIYTWNRSIGELTLFNGTRYKLFSAEEPERLRGPQHHRAWADEVAAWPNPETWDQLSFTLRLGSNPQVVATTTPKPNPLIKRIAKTPGAMITRGNTFENAENLAENALAFYRQRYEGTRLGRQELYAEMLEDVQGALWTADMIDATRMKAPPSELERIVIAVDPSGTSGNGKRTSKSSKRKGSGLEALRNEGRGDDVGIVAAGKGRDGRFYVLEDGSCNLSPEGWARKVLSVYERWDADRIVAERNFGGAMVEAVLRTADKNLPIRMVTASRGKVARAEPVAALYEQGKVSHCGAFNDLEDQMCSMTGAGYVGEGSPDRADALVWALSDLSSQAGFYDISVLG
ncbi:DNA-packaging protein [Novosphingobium olei]|uniref:DNA-packaging protein n=1 Tax=Novosphingobium olei TaxID=2728851 RepID=A0A7Y0BQH3_9SPHN|nr:terminase family protein [Novosphingobium olei]NML94740.1 DNA-packaging protein [Novosphingobium olei]